MGTIFQDLTNGVRVHRKSPGIAILCLITLALGLGASTVVFSVVNAVLLRPLPYPNHDAIVVVWKRAPISADFGSFFQWDRAGFSVFRGETKTFQDLGALMSDSFNLTGNREPARLDGIRASAGFFPSLGIPPQLGRFFTSDEDRPGYEHEVVLSDQLWRDRFERDPAILGRWRWAFPEWPNSGYRWRSQPRRSPAPTSSW